MREDIDMAGEDEAVPLQVFPCARDLRDGLGIRDDRQSRSLTAGYGGGVFPLLRATLAAVSSTAHRVRKRVMPSGEDRVMRGARIALQSTKITKLPT